MLPFLRKEAPLGLQGKAEPPLLAIPPWPAGPFPSCRRCATSIGKTPPPLTLKREKERGGRERGERGTTVPWPWHDRAMPRYGQGPRYRERREEGGERERSGVPSEEGRDRQGRGTLCLSHATARPHLGRAAIGLCCSMTKALAIEREKGKGGRERGMACCQKRGERERHGCDKSHLSCVAARPHLGRATVGHGQDPHYREREGKRGGERERSGWKMGERERHNVPSEEGRERDMPCLSHVAARSHLGRAMSGLCPGIAKALAIERERREEGRERGTAGRGEREAQPWLLDCAMAVPRTGRWPHKIDWPAGSRPPAKQPLIRVTQGQGRIRELDGA